MKFVLIHGIGNQDANLQWFRDAISGLKGYPLSLQFVPFYWEDLRQPPKEAQYEQAHGCNPLFVATALSGLSDLLEYGDTLDAALDRLDKTIGQLDEPCVLVAHSLGSVLAYEYLALYLNNADKVHGLITLGSPIGRWPVSTRIKRRLGCIHALPEWWVNIAGTKDYVTSWLGGGRIKEADVNHVLKGYTHDLKAYLSAPSTKFSLECFLTQK